MAIIYKYTSRVNGKVYVGKTSQELSQRHRQHRFGRHSPFNDALRKHGVENFDLEVLVDVDSDDANFTEMIFIAALRSNDRIFGYNVTAGGEGTVGHRHRTDTKDRIRQKMMGRFVSDEFRKKIGILKLGNTYSLGTIFTPEQREAVSARMQGNKNALGATRSPETRRMMALAKMGNTFGRRSHAANHGG
jgi:group I intron endonuclease